MYGLGNLFFHSYIGKLFEEEAGYANIALFHTIFNVITSVCLLPFTRQLEKLSHLIIRDKDSSGEKTVLLDERLLLTPSFAVPECHKAIIQMGSMAQKSLVEALSLIEGYNAKTHEQIKHLEKEIDIYEDKVGAFLIKLAAKELNHADSAAISKLLHIVTDIERIGDHADNIAVLMFEMSNKSLAFSPQAKAELSVICEALKEVMSITFNALKTNDVELALNVEPLEEVIDELQAELRTRHIERLKDRTCSIELGFLLSDLLNGLERISDHCSNIAVTIIQGENENFDAHEYLHKLHHSQDEHYVKTHEYYEEKFNLSAAAV
jgi:phosphate:Na+ symporter